MDHIVVTWQVMLSSEKQVYTPAEQWIKQCLWDWFCKLSLSDIENVSRLAAACCARR